MKINNDIESFLSDDRRYKDLLHVPVAMRSGALRSLLVVLALQVAFPTVDACGRGCFAAGSRLSTGSGRRASGNEPSDDEGLRVTNATNLIILDHSPLFLVECPSTRRDSVLTLRSETPIESVSSALYLE